MLYLDGQSLSLIPTDLYRAAVDTIQYMSKQAHKQAQKLAKDLLRNCGLVRRLFAVGACTVRLWTTWMHYDPVSDAKNCSWHFEEFQFELF